jgi:phosphoribosyl-dephospho-CoA transferase
VNQDTDLGSLTAGVAQIDATAPMRIDGELIRADGAGVTWREFYGQSAAVLVKMPGGAVLLEPREFLTQPARAMRFTAESPS